MIWLETIVAGPSGLALSALLAYLDPGAGSFVLQAVIGAVFSVGFVMRNYWRGLWSAFRRRPEANPAGPAAAPAGGADAAAADVPNRSTNSPPRAAA